MLEQGLQTRLQVASVGTRVYPQYLPQGVQLPAVSYRLISDPSLHDSDGPAGLTPATYIVTIYARTYNELKTASTQLRDALDGHSGTLGSVPVSRIYWRGGPERLEPVADPDDDVPGIHRQDVTINIHY